MKAISLWQPWASLWLSPAKVHETRHWPTSHRGWLAVHAAKKLVSDCGEDLDLIVIEHFGAHWRTTLPRGALIGAVRLVRCSDTDAMPIGPQSTDDYQCGDFSRGRYAWERAAFHVFPEPIPYRGMQSMFEVPDDILPKIAA